VYILRDLSELHNTTEVQRNLSTLLITEVLFPSLIDCCCPSRDEGSLWEESTGTGTGVAGAGHRICGVVVSGCDLGTCLSMDGP
jgi:hypothetical protein